MTGLLIEVFLTLVGIGILVALIWLVFNYRDLSHKLEAVVQEGAKEIAELRTDITKLKQRLGI